MKNEKLKNNNNKKFTVDSFFFAICTRQRVQKNALKSSQLDKREDEVMQKYEPTLFMYEHFI